jgi:dihydrofolate reductase
VRKIIVYIAMSADGYIARPDGDVAWLDRPRTAGDYGMRGFYKSIDTVIMGRKTYELALKFGQKGYAGKTNYVFTRSRRRRTANIEFVREALDDFARQLRDSKGKGVWLVGGAELIGAFLDADQIDEFIIHMIPTFIGEGIPLFRPRPRSVPLELLSTRAYSDGVVRLHYSVCTRSSQRGIS